MREFQRVRIFSIVRPLRCICTKWDEWWRFLNGCGFIHGFVSFLSAIAIQSWICWRGYFSRLRICGSGRKIPSFRSLWKAVRLNPQISQISSAVKMGLWSIVIDAIYYTLKGRLGVSIFGALAVGMKKNASDIIHFQICSYNIERITVILCFGWNDWWERSETYLSKWWRCFELFSCSRL